MREVELHTCADDHRAEERQKQKQHIEPPALSRWRNDPDRLGLLVPFEGGWQRGCGFGHGNLRSEVRDLTAEVGKTLAIRHLPSAIARAPSQSTAVPCQA